MKKGIYILIILILYGCEKHNTIIDTKRHGSTNFVEDGTFDEYMDTEIWDWGTGWRRNNNKAEHNVRNYWGKPIKSMRLSINKLSQRVEIPIYGVYTLWLDVIYLGHNASVYAIYAGDTLNKLTHNQTGNMVLPILFETQYQIDNPYLEFHGIGYSQIDNIKIQNQ